ncbi:hypothetical protein BT96DRAFT_917659 [Gymnopus androsaceus JB14]|uniref:F-box domain-containing protein n=1 Tax=Gymnopus androsaceus JB14 TaxID=1447944 RepID=A0A6A4HXG8_9AGAR|nr:hypothetical protein BT96DRAFT_917659 [Gymnopus androsaceus JB14]
MTSETKLSRSESFQLRTNVDCTEIRKRLRSENGPAIKSDNEISRILVNVEKDLEDYEAEVHRLQSRLIFIRNQRQRLQKYKSYVSSFKSPIRTMPKETILLIFEYACDMNELTSKSLRSMPALTVSSVCWQWRDLARSCPDLWSRMSFKSDKTHPSIPLLNLYLDLSHQSPLTLEFPEGRTEPMLEPHHFTEHECTRSDGRSFTVPLVNMHEHHFPWQQLTSLDIAQFGVGMKELFQVFAFAIYAGSTIEHCAPPITALAVEKLLQACEDVIFASIACPSLKSLVIEGLGTQALQSWPKDDLNAFIACSSFHLETLSINSVHVPSGHSPITSHLVRSLHAFPHITSGITSSALVTQLQTLSLTFTGSDTFSDSDFVDMVSSRWYPDVFTGGPSSASETACLRSVVMRCVQRNLDKEIYRPLKHLEEAGMRVVVTGKNSMDHA